MSHDRNSLTMLHESLVSRVTSLSHSGLSGCPLQGRRAPRALMSNIFPAALLSAAPGEAEDVEAFGRGGGFRDPAGFPAQEDGCYRLGFGQRKSLQPAASRAGLRRTGRRLGRFPPRWRFPLTQPARRRFRLLRMSDEEDSAPEEGAEETCRMGPVAVTRAYCPACTSRCAGADAHAGQPPAAPVSFAVGCGNHVGIVCEGLFDSFVSEQVFRHDLPAQISLWCIVTGVVHLPDRSWGSPAQMACHRIGSAAHKPERPGRGVGGAGLAVDLPAGNGSPPAGCRVRAV